MEALAFTDEDWLEFERELYARSLSEFVQAAWHVLEPGTPYVHGWHVDAICEHLEAVTDGEITRLLINIPPGTMKSTLGNVFWPAWEWGAAELPAHRIISASHEAGLAVRDTRKMRMLIQSDWYQRLWPVQLVDDQNQKTYYENDATGFRQACAVASMTGKRGHRVIWDDPHSVEAALSEAKRTEALRVFHETLPSRINDPTHSAIVIIMQRLHQLDVSGEILEGDYGYEHLCLPMEFEKKRRCVTSTGFKDPRTKENELLFPERFPREVVDRDKKIMGSYATAGQFQQDPAPRAGAFFEWQNLKIVEAAPNNFVRMVRYWDKAGTEGGGARTSGTLMGVDKQGDYYVLDVVKGQWAASNREKVIKSTADTDKSRYGMKVKIWIEQEPGSGGKESAESTVKNLAGYSIYSERPTGEKTLRAEPYSVQVEAGNVYVLNAPWTKEFIDEHKVFPVGKYKDQIDSTSGAFNKLATSRYSLSNV